MGIVRFKIKCSLLRLYQHLSFLSCRERKIENPKALICCIGKNENRYVREFVEWHKRIGFSHITLYDNNDIDGEKFEDVIQDYIDEGFVETVDFRGKKICQLESYIDCYKKKRADFDWIAFLDMDEFLELKEDATVSDFLSRDIFKDAWIIHVNWLCYGDNGHILSTDAPVTERFSVPAPMNIVNSTWNCPYNNYIKSFVRCNEHMPLFWKRVPHTPYPTILKCCSSTGTKCDAESSSLEFNDSALAILHHYTTKSTEEYVMKIERGYADQLLDRKLIGRMINQYFDLNPDTEERRRYISNWLAGYSSGKEQ